MTAGLRSDLLPTLDEIKGLSDDDARANYCDANPELLTVELAERVLSEAVQLLRVDLQQSGDVVATARYIAQRLDSPRLQALADRAQANFLHFSGHHNEAQRFYEQAVAKLSALEETLEVAITRSSALVCLAYTGRSEQVEQWADAARQTFEDVGDRQRLAVLDNNEAGILYRQDRWREALERYQSAHAEFVRSGRHQDAVVALRNIAVCQISLLEFENALDSYERARQFCVDNGLTRLLHEVDYNIAYLYYVRSEYTRSIELYQDARERCRAEGDEYHMALCDLDQGEMYLELNLVEEASSLAQSAYTIFDRLEMPYESAKALTNYAIAESRLGRGFLALDLLAKARAIFVRENNRLWPSQIDVYRGHILFREGRYFEAKRLAQRALDSFRASGLKGHAVSCLLLLAQLELAPATLGTERAERERAEPASGGEPSDSEMAARRYCEDAMADLAALDRPVLDCQAYFILGQIEEVSGRPAAALAAYQQSRDRLERLRIHLHREDLKISFLDDKQQIYESLVALHFAQGEVDAAFDYIERAKSRSLVDLLMFRSPQLTHDLEPHSEMAQEVRRLRQELNWYYRQIDLRQFRDGQSPTELTDLREAAENREHELLDTLGRLQSADERLVRIDESTTVSHQSLQNDLGSETVLVEYFIARDLIYAVIVDATQVRMMPVAVAHHVLELQRLLLFQLSKMRHQPERVEGRSALTEQAVRSHLSTLYAELIAPLEDYLGANGLLVVPHGFLHYLPFHALWDGEEYLIDRFAISYAPSATIYSLCAQRRVEPHREALVLGLPDETTPHIEDEVQAVASVLPGAELHVGANATVERLRTDGSSCRHVHIATHGLFRADNPMFSALQLGDARLSLFDLYDLQFEAELIALSGCATGLNVVLGADELLGLTRGLLFAGARCSLVSLWDVNDESTSELTRSFYEHLVSGLDAASALRRAMTQMRERYPSPYFWAPFVLVGAARPFREA